MRAILIGWWIPQDQPANQDRSHPCRCRSKPIRRRAGAIGRSGDELPQLRTVGYKCFGWFHNGEHTTEKRRAAQRGKVPMPRLVEELRGAIRPAVRLRLRTAAVPTALGSVLIAYPALHAGLDYYVRFADSRWLRFARSQKLSGNRRVSKRRVARRFLVLGRDASIAVLHAAIMKHQT